MLSHSDIHAFFGRFLLDASLKWNAAHSCGFFCFGQFLINRYAEITAKFFYSKKSGTNLMKHLVRTFAVLLLCIGGNVAFAQSSETISNQQEITFEKFDVLFVSGSETAHWLIEGTGLTNELGERFVELGTNPKAELVKRLETIRNNSLVTVFELSEDKTQLTIGMQGMNAAQVAIRLTEELQKQPTH